MVPDDLTPGILSFPVIADAHLPARPKMFRVLMHYVGDLPKDKMESWYELVLKQCFNKLPLQAASIYIAAKMARCAIIGVYTKDIAETKVEQARKFLVASGVGSVSMIDLEAVE